MPLKKVEPKKPAFEIPTAPLPASLTKGIYKTVQQFLPKRRRLMIGTEGPSESGKTRFMLTCPGPVVILAVDRGVEGCLEVNNDRDDVAVIPFMVPRASVTDVTKSMQDLNNTEYVNAWRDLRSKYYQALDNVDARTVCLDGDTDSWELQRLAAFGKLKSVPSLMYADVYMARKSLISHAYDSGKVVVHSHMVREGWRDQTDANGEPIKDDSGKTLRERSGEYERQGYDDTEYLWHVQLRHVIEFKDDGPHWGITILDCKQKMELVGTTLWDEQCNFAGLVELMYPDVSAEEWFQ